MPKLERLIKNSTVGLPPKTPYMTPAQNEANTVRGQELHIIEMRKLEILLLATGNGPVRMVNSGFIDDAGTLFIGRRIPAEEQTFSFQDRIELRDGSAFYIERREKNHSPALVVTSRSEWREI